MGNKTEKDVQAYRDYVKTKTPVHGLPLNMVKAFLTGGAICTLGEFILNYAEKMGLENVGFFARKDVGGIEAGSGVIGELPEPLSATDFVRNVKKQFGVDWAMCNELLKRPVRCVAICGGAGDFLLDEAIKEGADAFVTGEMHYHVYFGHGQEIQICVIGHYQSELFTK